MRGLPRLTGGPSRRSQTQPTPSQEESRMASGATLDSTRGGRGPPLRDVAQSFGEDRRRLLNAEVVKRIVPRNFDLTPAYSRGSTPKGVRPLHIVGHPTNKISIHAPHTRGDYLATRSKRPHKISIHAPHTRGDHAIMAIAHIKSGFQSTPLIRGATSTSTGCVRFELFQSTPLIRGATIVSVGISRGVEFQSTPLIRGAT